MVESLERDNKKEGKEREKKRSSLRYCCIFHVYIFENE